MKRFLLSVFAVAALAIGWVGGNGLASSTGPNADTRRAAEITALSFPDDPGILVSWQNEQKRRQTLIDKNSGIDQEIKENEQKIALLKTRLSQLTESIEHAKKAIREESLNEDKIAFQMQAGEFLGKLEALKTRIEQHPWVHHADWEKVNDELGDELKFDDMLKHSEKASAVLNLYTAELTETNASFRAEFEALKNANQQHLPSRE